ncbi:MAG TPA: hypothetical protein VFC97_01940, partial [Verrucomicrobiae bacterium]|nr:hypothetical protein [Verrucomicrobiae bacterium]
MAEILTESFCERCGSRYTFEAGAGRRRGLGRIRTLSRGVKNFVANDDASFSDAMALARDEDERKASLQQLDAFHQTFNFCMTCRQYTCRNCWNSAAGECLSCAPDLSREVLPAAFPDLTVVGPETTVADPAESSPPSLAPTAWPSTDVRVEAAPPPIVTAPGPPADSAAPDVAAESEAAVAAETEAAVVAEAALAAPSEVPPAFEILTTAEAAPAAEILPTIDTASQAEAVPEFAAEAEVAVTVEAGLEAVEARPAEAAAASAFGSPDESDLELTATELAAVEGALNRQVSRAESAAVASTTSGAVPAAETNVTGPDEPVLGGQAETRRFFQRFRLRRGRSATSMSAIPLAATGETAAITPPPALDATMNAAPAPEPEPVAVRVAVAAPETTLAPEQELELVAVEVTAAAPEPVPEPEPVEVAAAAPEAEQELQLVAVEVAAAEPEAVREPEPVAVAATAPEPVPESEPK